MTDFAITTDKVYNSNNDDDSRKDEEEEEQQSGHFISMNPPPPHLPSIPILILLDSLYTASFPATAHIDIIKYN